MKLRFWIVFAIILMLSTSCNSFSSSPQPTTESIPPDATHTAAVEGVEDSATSTSMEPEKPTVQPPTTTKTQESPTMTTTAFTTITPSEPPQTPTPSPTKKLGIKPSATQAMLSVQIGSPVGVPNFAHPDLGCQWMGLAGQVLDIGNLPFQDLVVEVGGTLAGQPIFGLAITGRVEAYGPGGYEIQLADEPIGSSGTAWAQVYDLDGEAISALTYFPTYSECERNLIILNFVQGFEPPSSWAFLPVVYKNSSNP